MESFNVQPSVSGFLDLKIFKTHEHYSMHQYFIPLYC